MQLGANDVAPARVMNTAVPFEFRFQAPPAAAETAGRTLISARAAESAPVAPEVTPTVVAAPETAVRPALPISSASVAETPPINSPAPQAPLAAAPADGVPQGPVSAAPQNTQQDGKPGAANDVAARTPAASALIGDPDAASKTKILPERANPAAPNGSAHITRRRRPLIVRRLQRSRPAASGQAARQSFTGIQPGYQWATPSGPGAPQTVHRRVIVRRARPAKQQAKEPVAASTTPQTAVSNTPVKPPE